MLSSLKKDLEQQLKTIFPEIEFQILHNFKSNTLSVCYDDGPEFERVMYVCKTIVSNQCDIKIYRSITVGRMVKNA